MKPRKWVLVVALIFLALISAYQYGLYRLSKNRNLENLLIEQVGSVIGGELDVDNIKIGFFSTTLSGLKISIPFGQTAIEVDKIRIGFSFAQYLISRGDITSSLSSIVLVDPVINIRIPDKQDADTLAVTEKSEKSKANYEMPVKSILLRNGSVHLISRWRQRVLSVDKLNGKLLEVNNAVEFDLKGRLASTGKNLNFNGSLQKDDGTLNLSARLSKARISKKIEFKDLSIYKGTLDGVAEFKFTDAPFPENISAVGHVTISSGKGSLSGFDEKLNNLNMSVLFENNIVNIGKMSCDLMGMDISLTGKSGYSVLQESRFNIGIKNIRTETVLKKNKIDYKDLSGVGTANIEVIKPKNEVEFKVKSKLSGIKFKDKIIEKFTLQSTINSGEFNLKEGILETDGFQLSAKGTVNYMKKPFVYSFTSKIKGSNSFLYNKLDGNFSGHGFVKGIGDKVNTEMILSSNRILYDSLNLGKTKLLFKYDGRKAVIETFNDDYYFINGRVEVDSLSGKEPSVSAKINLYGRPFVELINKNLPQSDLCIEKIYADIDLKGKLEDLSVKSNFVVESNLIDGKLNLFANKIKDHWDWNFNGDSITLNNQPFPIKGNGTVQDERLTVDKFVLLDKINVSGDIALDSSQIVDLRMDWDSLSLTKIDRMFLSGDSLIYSGILKGSIRVQESMKAPVVLANFGLRNGIFAGMDSVSTDFVLFKNSKELRVLPFLLRKNGDIIATIDTLKIGDKFSLKGEFSSIDLNHFVKEADIEDLGINGKVSGRFYNENGIFPVFVNFKSDTFKISNWTFSDIKSSAKIYPDSINLTNASAVDDKGVSFNVSARVPSSFLFNEEKETDTLFLKAKINGDVLKTFGSHVENPVGGHGVGDCKIEFFIADDELVFTQAFMNIESGYMTVYPFVPDTVKDISLFLSVDEESKLSLDFRGKVNKRPVQIYTTHDIPEGLEPFKFGLINAGIIEVKTGEKGIPLYLPGFLEEKNVADIEFAPKDSMRAFTLSGPVDKFRLTGTWVIRNAEFTFPFIDEQPPPEDDPFPYVTWDLDLRIGNRNVTYFYNVGGKKRRVMRFVECSLDPPTTQLGVRGRDRDGTFRLIGKIRSYRGNVFYGKIFDRNFELGCNFVPVKNNDGHGYNNLPIIWGSVEAFSDTSRFDRITLKLLTKDPVTGSMNERGRFNDITFRLSSNFEEVPGESEREFFREAGLNIVTLKGAGGYVSDFGDSYVNQYLLGRIERKIARKLGLDVISVETSVASNYFNYLADSSFGGFSDQLYYLTFANVGVTIGRYFLRDRIFLKWRTELMPNELNLVPEHSIGFEYQPVKYLWFDFNYGFHRENGEFQYDPKVMMQLRMPLDRIKKAFNADK